MTEYEIAIDSAVEMTQIDSVAISIEPAADSTISDTTIYPPLSALNETMEPDTSSWPSLEKSPSHSGTYANYMTGTHRG